MNTAATPSQKLIIVDEDDNNSHLIYVYVHLVIVYTHAFCARSGEPYDPGTPREVPPYEFSLNRPALNQSQTYA